MTEATGIPDFEPPAGDPSADNLAPDLADLTPQDVDLAGLYPELGALTAGPGVDASPAARPTFVQKHNLPDLDELGPDPDDEPAPTTAPVATPPVAVDDPPASASAPSAPSDLENADFDLLIALNRFGVLLFATLSTLLAAVVSVVLLANSSADLVIDRYTLSLFALAIGAAFTAVGVLDVYRLRRVWTLGVGLALQVIGWIGVVTELEQFASDVRAFTYTDGNQRSVPAVAIILIAAATLLLVACYLALNPMLPPHGRPGRRSGLDVTTEEGELPLGYRLRDVGTVLKSSVRAFVETLSVWAWLGTTHIGFYGGASLGIVGAKIQYDRNIFAIQWPATAVVLFTLSVVFGIISAVGAGLVFFGLLPRIRVTGKLGYWLVAIGQVGLAATLFTGFLTERHSGSGWLISALILSFVPLVGAACALIGVAKPLLGTKPRSHGGNNSDPTDAEDSYCDHDCEHDHEAECDDTCKPFCDHDCEHDHEAECDDTCEAFCDHDCEHDDEAECTPACETAETLPPDPNRRPLASRVASGFAYVVGGLTLATGFAVDTYDFRSARPYAVLIGAVIIVGGLLLSWRIWPLVLALGHACGMLFWVNLAYSSPPKNVAGVAVVVVLLLISATGIVTALWPSNWRWVLAKKHPARQPDAHAETGRDPGPR